MLDRKRAIEKVRSKLLKTGFPRLNMGVMLVLSGTAGFLASFALLRAGLPSLGLRYMLAVLVSYGAFLPLVRMWMRSRRRGAGTHNRWLDTGADLNVFPSPTGTAKDLRLGGGHSGGAGASGSWQGSELQAPDVASFATQGSAKTSDLGWTDLGELEELNVVVIGVLVFLATLVTVLASAYVVYIAPTLFAELVIDGVVLGGVYSRLRRVERQHWLTSVLKATWLPAVLTVLLFGSAGFVIQAFFPNATSFGDVWNQLR